MYMQVELIIFSLVICMKLLRKGGKFVAKMFKVGAREDYDEVITSSLYSVKSDFYYEKVKILFDNVFYFKPSSSRASSHETYLICEGYDIESDCVKKVIEESLKENIDDIKTKKEIKEKINMTSTEDKQNHKENNVINGSNSDNNKLMTINIINKIDNDHNSDKEEKKIIEENSDKINNNENNQDNTNQISNNENKNKNKDLKTAENSSDDDSQNEPLKYISSSLQKDYIFLGTP